MHQTRSTTLRACLHALALWSLLLSVSFAVPAAASGECPTRLVRLSLGAEQFSFCAPTGLPSNLVKDDHDPGAAYAQFNQLDGYGILNLRSLAAEAGPGPGRPVYRGQRAAEYLRQVQDLESQKPDRSVSAGPSALLWGETVPGLAIRTAASDSTGGLSLRSVEWYVERLGRLWVVMLAWDAGLENAQEWERAAQTFAITPAGHFTGPDAAIDLGQAFTRSQQPADASELVDVGTPAWWDGACNDGNYFPATGAHSFPLGPAWRGLVPCGPRPYTVSTPDHLVRFFPNAWGQYEFECVELVMRFLYQQWGIAPWSGNGNTIKNSPPASVVFYPNGTPSITPGDILTEDGWAGNAFGHAAVITAVDLDAAGTGTISILEQNSHPTGARSLNVVAWEVQPDAWIHGQPIQGWLHAKGTSRASVTSGGAQGNDASTLPSISAGGQVVAFASSAGNLVSGDSNDASDVFLHDDQTGQTVRVSVASDGVQGNGASTGASISADGRFVAFDSVASTLVSGDTNGVTDVFVHELQTGETSRVSLNGSGTQGSGVSQSPSLSADGRYVAFESAAANLVAGDTNASTDIFLRDRQAGATERVSVASGGAQAEADSTGPSISADGRYIAFMSLSGSLVSGDTNGLADIFVRDRTGSQTDRVSVSTAGTQANGASGHPSISADGRFVAFDSAASSLVSGDTNGKQDVFVRDMQTGKTERVSVASDGAQANQDSSAPSISANGRFVAFASSAANLVTGDLNAVQDVFVHDRQTGKTRLVSLASGGLQGSAASASPSLSADGGFVAFQSQADDLVNGDTNTATDVFLHAIGWPPDVYTISGDAGAAGVKLSYSDGGPRSVTSATDGTYSLQVLSGWSGTVTPSRTGYTFGPSRRTYDNILADQPDQDYTAFANLRLRSTAVLDGWVLESVEAAGLGSTINRGSPALLVGDDAQNRQYRSILSFNTAGLPDGAVITSVTLKVRRSAVVGTDPFSTHGRLLVDIQTGAFSEDPALQPDDFQAVATKESATVMTNNPLGGWFSKRLASTSFTYIDKTGLTQFRLRFELADNDDLGADALRFFSGNALNPADRPALIIGYYVP